jgi:NTE family protein
MDAGASRGLPPAEHGAQPRINDIIGTTLQASLVDPVLRDVRHLAEVNTMFADDHARRGTQRDRRIRGKRPFRVVPYAYVAPRERGTISRIAREVYARRYGGWRALRGVGGLDYPVLDRVLAGSGEGRSELLSYLFFDAEYSRRLIAEGRRDAEGWLAAHPDIFIADATPFTEIGAAAGRGPRPAPRSVARAPTGSAGAAQASPAA